MTNPNDFIENIDKGSKIPWRALFKHYFDIHADTQDSSKIIDSVEQGTVFRGVNLWALIGAIFIASLGLNTNSTAVIIGAMLVSPLMGPIIAIGLSVSTNNILLLKFAWKNLVLFVGISLIISAFYFFVSPLKEPTAELTARTFPTIYDVLIALFGGTVGMISNGQKEKSNVIPGVAIATALMPPLCTAGYGIATGNLSFFFGAMYLFTINTVMIAFASLAVSKFILKMPVHRYANPLQTKRVNRLIVIVLLATILPSIYLAYNLVLRTFYEQRVNQFIQNELTSNNIIVLSKKVSYKDRSIELFMLTSPPKEKQKSLEEKLKNYELPKSKLAFKGIDALIEDNQHSLTTEIQRKEMMVARITDSLKSVKGQLQQAKNKNIELKDQNTKLAKMLNAIDPNIVGVGITSINTFDSSPNTTQWFVVTTKGKLNKSSKEQVERLVKVQYPTSSIRVVYE